jgi:3-oxoadipate enol-lactonase
MIDAGRGTPVVLVPGSQGRWEWAKPTVDALKARCRVLTYSLCGEPGSEMPIDRELGFDSFLAQLDAVLDHAGLDRATICGVSYGGWIGARYAARRSHRVDALVLVSTPSPTWRPNPTLARYLRAPRLWSPMFVLGAAGRLYPEVAAAFPHRGAQLRFFVTHTLRVIRAPLSPSRAAERARLFEEIDLVKDCARISAPTLIVTGEPGLDRVVPVESTREYERYLPAARFVQLDHTGHIGSVTHADRFAELVAGFAGAHARRDAVRRPA